MIGLVDASPCDVCIEIMAIETEPISSPMGPDPFVR